MAESTCLVSVLELSAACVAVETQLTRFDTDTSGASDGNNRIAK